jgi:hypothetical protein
MPSATKKMDSSSKAESQFFLKVTFLFMSLQAASMAPGQCEVLESILQISISSEKFLPGPILQR